MDYAIQLAAEFSLDSTKIQNVINLLKDGNTIPFIARYRKEEHGSMDDQLLRKLADKLEYLEGMDKRREEIVALIDAQEKLTDEIRKSIENAKTLTELEDIYRPFRPKRKTRASVAKEKGLEPLSQLIFEQGDIDPAAAALEYIDEEKGVTTVDDALQGARDIIAETVSDNAEIRKRTRNLLWHNGEIVSVASDKDAESVYQMYYEFKQPISKIAGHRVLAINRGEKEKFLKVSANENENKALSVIKTMMVKGYGECAMQVQEACEDAYSRLIYPSVEREIRNELTEKASMQAIELFKVNLKQLLMQPPVKNNIVMGLDPGYRTGCKVAVVDSTGKVLDTTVVYPTHSKQKIEQSKVEIKNLINKHGVNVIAIGNGTATKETEIFAAEIIKEIPQNVQYMVVSEAGASVYSASKLAADELPELDLTLRSAVSIARRLQDPLAELVKIDPKAIGVGQYQHDMPQKQLSEALSGVVEDCVNTVGADLNTASPALLSEIAGISAAIAKNIVSYREENGEFKSRTELKKVSKLGPKAFEQCAGFLRIPGGKEPFDNTGIHPESYKAAKKLLEICGFDRKDIVGGKLKGLTEAIKEKGAQNICDEIGVGLPTLKDIADDLLKPGRDPRDELPKPVLRSDVMDINDLKTGMTINGTVRNVIDFGAFVDIGVHQDGLVHISQICNRYIKHPSEVLKVGDVVKVRILEVDKEKNRISLSMKDE